MKLEDIHYVIGTGYGRVNVPFAHKAITEIACHARGANYMGGTSVRTILDMGGQDCKAIHCDEKGKVTNFLMNDKCAAGTGRGMEVIADLMQIPIAELGDRVPSTSTRSRRRCPRPAWCSPSPRRWACSRPATPRTR